MFSSQKVIRVQKSLCCETEAQKHLVRGIQQFPLDVLLMGYQIKSYLIKNTHKQMRTGLNKSHTLEMQLIFLSLYYF